VTVRGCSVYRLIVNLTLVFVFDLDLVGFCFRYSNMLGFFRLCAVIKILLSLLKFRIWRFFLYVCWDKCSAYLGF
jgi:hypothetical protein